MGLNNYGHSYVSDIAHVGSKYITQATYMNIWTYMYFDLLDFDATGGLWVLTDVSVQEMWFCNFGTPSMSFRIPLVQTSLQHCVSFRMYALLQISII